MSDDYGYINARIRAMKSFLLKEEEYQEALRQDSPEEFCAFLSGRPSYTNDLQEASSLAAKSRYDEALRANLCRIFQKIIRFCSGEPKKMILVLLMYYDIYNLKAIIRGILNYKSKDEITQVLIPAGKWDLAFLSKLAELKGLKALAANIASGADSDLENGFAKLIRNYTPETPIEILENSIDKFYFEKAAQYLSAGGVNAGILSGYLSLKVDFSNILSALKKISQGTNTEFGIMPAGKLRKDFFQDMLKYKSVESALKIFENSVYPWLAGEGLQLYQRRQKLSSLERLFKRKIFQYSLRLYRQGDPLSMSIPLGFINFKENEINNLRLIGESLYFGIPKDAIKNELIFAG